jgi:hypothetical protein
MDNSSRNKASIGKTIEKLRKLYPDMSEAELEESAENLRAHAALSIRMWLRRKHEAEANTDSS